MLTLARKLGGCRRWRLARDNKIQYCFAFHSCHSINWSWIVLYLMTRGRGLQLIQLISTPPLNLYLILSLAMAMHVRRLFTAFVLSSPVIQNHSQCKLLPPNDTKSSLELDSRRQGLARMPPHRHWYVRPVIGTMNGTATEEPTNWQEINNVV